MLKLLRVVKVLVRFVESIKSRCIFAFRNKQIKNSLMKELEKQIKLMNIFYDNLEGATDKERKDILEGIAILAKKIIFLTNKK